jgi:hypothetical protein
MIKVNCYHDDSLNVKITSQGCCFCTLSLYVELICHFCLSGLAIILLIDIYCIETGKYAFFVSINVTLLTIYKSRLCNRLRSPRLERCRSLVRFPVGSNQD